MSKESLSYCGYRCDICPAFLATRRNDFDALSKLSMTWEHLFGFHIEPEQLQCDGCAQSGRRVDKNCSVRPCCTEKRYKTCADCGDYPCENLRKRFVERTEIERKLGHQIPEATYTTYVKPFESKARLDKMFRKKGR